MPRFLIRLKPGIYRFSDKNRFASSRLDAVLVAPFSTKTKKQQTSNERGWVLGVAGGNWGRPGALQQHRHPPPSDPPSPDSTDPKISAFSDVTNHFKYCEDARPQNQLSAAQEQHKCLCSILQGASVTLHTILLGVDGTICNNHTLEPLNR